ncbi:hypothetical protein [Sulfitobacter sp. R18_1]|uniref:hypothetical protein n=1 Tax=Sulfitobacter sp. R18_1 TaxID=2821104 RepID=UPI001ADA6C3C|nr:hypothetical protein [Sulfitobacter sp. R18_1]MBO9428838.1 hypothetical protein [Sulfitobacter sp. R18_1]
MFFQDLHGSGFNCHAMDCMVTWDYDEIVEPEPVEAIPKDPDAEMWNNIAIVAAS